MGRVVSLEQGSTLYIKQTIQNHAASPTMQPRNKENIWPRFPEPKIFPGKKLLMQRRCSGKNTALAKHNILPRSWLYGLCKPLGTGQMHSEDGRQHWHPARQCRFLSAQSMPWLNNGKQMPPKVFIIPNLSKCSNLDHQLTQLKLHSRNILG